MIMIGGIALPYFLFSFFLFFGWGGRKLNFLVNGQNQYNIFCLKKKKKIVSAMKRRTEFLEYFELFWYIWLADEGT